MCDVYRGVTRDCQVVSCHNTVGSRIGTRGPHTGVVINTPNTYATVISRDPKLKILSLSRGPVTCTGLTNDAHTSGCVGHTEKNLWLHVRSGGNWLQANILVIISNWLQANMLVIISKTLVGLQKLMDCLETFCQERGLTVKITKTKVLVFGSRTCLKKLRN